jgi:UrcA family protein
LSAASYINRSTPASGENPAAEGFEAPQAIAEYYSGIALELLRGQHLEKGTAMKITSLSSRTGYFTASKLAMLGLVLSGGAALAQQVEEITVVAPHEIERRVVGRSKIGAPIEQISLTHRVDFSDLNLAKPDDLATLRQRVADEAKLACDELDKLYPLDRDRARNRRCVRDTNNDAQAQINAAVQAMASKPK